MEYRETINNYKLSMQNEQTLKEELGRARKRLFTSASDNILEYISNSHWVIIPKDSTPCGYYLVTKDDRFVSFMDYVKKYNPGMKYNMFELSFGFVRYDREVIMIVPNRQKESELDQYLLHVDTTEIGSKTSECDCRTVEIQNKIDDIEEAIRSRGKNAATEKEEEL